MGPLTSTTGCTGNGTRLTSTGDMYNILSLLGCRFLKHEDYDQLLWPGLVPLLQDEGIKYKDHAILMQLLARN